MKKLLFIAAVAILAACSKQIDNVETTVDKYNGYDQFLKEGEVEKALKIRGGVIGTVTYGLILDPAPDDDFYPESYFYVTYETTGDWELVKTHMYAGKWKHKPRNRRGNRKRFRFPHKTSFDPYITTHTYKIDLNDLPPYTQPGFIVAAHAKVYNPAKCGDNGYRHAWAAWDRRFRCSGWGGYSIYYYEEPEEPHTNYYAIDYDANGRLNVYLIDIPGEEGEDPTADIIFYEDGVGTPPGDPDDGVAIDPESNNIYFIDYSTNPNTLMVNNLDEEDTDSYEVGAFPEDDPVTGITFQKDENSNTGTLYYVNEVDDPDGNTDFEIHAVLIEDDGNGGLTFGTNDVLVTIANDDILAIKDITFDPMDTQYLFLIGEVANEEAQLLIYGGGLLTQQDILDLNGEQISTTTAPQLAFSGDGTLYLIDGNWGSLSELSGAQTGQVIDTEESGITPLPDPGVRGVAGTISIPEN